MVPPAGLGRGTTSAPEEFPRKTVELRGFCDACA